MFPRIHRVHAAIGAVAILAAGAEPVHAQNIDSPYRFVDESQSTEVYAAYVWPDAGTLDLGATSGAMFGARYTIQISGPFAAEGDLGYFPSTRAVIDTTGAAVASTDFSLLLATAGLRLNLTGPRTFHGLMPYVLAVGGVALDLAGDDAEVGDVPTEARLDFGTSFAGGMAAGVEWLPTPRFGIRLSARDLIMQLETPEPLRLAEIEDVPEDEWVQNIILSAGITYRF